MTKLYTNLHYFTYFTLLERAYFTKHVGSLTLRPPQGLVGYVYTKAAWYAQRASIVAFVCPTVLRSGATRLILIVSHPEDSRDRSISYLIVGCRQPRHQCEWNSRFFRTRLTPSGRTPLGYRTQCYLVSRLGRLRRLSLRLTPTTLSLPLLCLPDKARLLCWPTSSFGHEAQKLQMRLCHSCSISPCLLVCFRWHFKKLSLHRFSAGWLIKVIKLACQLVRKIVNYNYN